MNPPGDENSLFSSGKPKKLPWFFFLVIGGLAVLVILYKLFS